VIPSVDASMNGTAGLVNVVAIDAERRGVRY
jgi:hypothetical protein